MKHTLLVELFTEELPPKALPRLAASFAGAIAASLDAVHGTTAYGDAVRDARAALAAPDSLPSARVLEAMAREHGNSFISFTRAQSLRTREHSL